MLLLALFVFEFRVPMQKLVTKCDLHALFFVNQITPQYSWNTDKVGVKHQLIDLLKTKLVQYIKYTLRVHGYIQKYVNYLVGSALLVGETGVLIIL